VAAFCIEHPDLARSWTEAGGTLVVLAAADEFEVATLLLEANASGTPSTGFREPDLGCSLTAIALLPDERIRRRLARLHLLLAERR
jgi:hypothetical protein